jgi:hypothetical protein
MATYSTNLRLTLLATGEGAGTWGNTANTNMGTLLEQAISGYETQTLTSGTTLTLTIPDDGASAVARNMYLEFNGNGSTVIVPSNKKLYFVYNNCTSGTITMKVAGQTGVTVANGKKQILVSNGTDIVQAVSPGIEGPVSSTDNAIALWSGTSGQVLKNSGVTVNSSGNITTSGDALINNVYIGRRTSQTGGGPDQNLIIGQSAAISLFSLGTQNLNTIVGNNAGNGLTGASSSGNFNTMFGYGAGGNGGNISFNTFLGYISGSNIAGSSNVAVGHAAMQGGGGNSAASNVGVGFQALLSITSGSQNVAVGNAAGDSISNSAWNTCVGGFAGTNVSTGSSNTLIGYLSGSGISTATTNSALGDSAYLTGNYTNSTCLGYNAQVDGDNQVQLGSSGTTTYVYGSVANRASDIRDKADVQDTNLGMNFIMQLRPRMYRWDYREDYRTKPPAKPNAAEYENRQDQYAADLAQWNTDYANWQEANKIGNLTHDGTHKRSRFHQGLIAQEVKQTMDAMGVDFGGYQDFKVKGGDDRLTLVYEELIPPLIKAIQELKAEFDEYKRTHP